LKYTISGSTLKADLLAVTTGVSLLLAGIQVANVAKPVFFLPSFRTFQVVFFSRWLDFGILLAASFASILMLLVLKVDRRIILGLITLDVASAILFTGSDPVVSLGATGLFIGALLVCFIGFKTFRGTDARFENRLAVVLLALAGAIEVWALPHWLFYPWVRNVASHVADVDIQLFYLPYSLVSVVFILFLVSWVAFPISWLRPRRKPTLEEDPQKKRLPAEERRGYMLLGLSFALGLLVTTYPYFKTTSRLVGVDIDCCYMPGLLKVLTFGPSSVVVSDRPLFWILLYLFQKATFLAPYQVLLVLSTVLTLATALAAFLFVRLGSARTYHAGWAAVLSVLIFNTTAGLILDLFTNWVTMIVAFLYFATLLKAVEFARYWKQFGAFALVLSVSLLFLHPYTWEIMLAVTFLFVLLRFGLQRREAVSLRFGRFVLLLAAVNLSAYAFRVWTGTLTGGVGLGVTLTSLSSYSDQSISMQTILGKLTDPVATLGTFWFNLQFFLRLTGVFYADWLTPLLGIGGMIYLCRNHLREPFTQLMVAWVLVSSIFTVMMGNFAAPYYSRTTYMPFIWRAFFDTPFQVPAGIALAKMKAWPGSGLLYFVIVMVFLNHALRSLAMSAIF
jgi:hypothetical protein